MRGVGLEGPRLLVERVRKARGLDAKHVWGGIRNDMAGEGRERQVRTRREDSKIGSIGSIPGQLLVDLTPTSIRVVKLELLGDSHGTDTAGRESGRTSSASETVTIRYQPSLSAQTGQASRPCPFFSRVRLLSPSSPHSPAPASTPSAQSANLQSVMSPFTRPELVIRVSTSFPFEQTTRAQKEHQSLVQRRTPRGWRAGSIGNDVVIAGEALVARGTRQGWRERRGLGQHTKQAPRRVLSGQDRRNSGRKRDQTRVTDTQSERPADSSES